MENFPYALVSVFTVLPSISSSSYLDASFDGRQVPVLLLICEVLLGGFIQNDTHYVYAIPKYLFQEVQMDFPSHEKAERLFQLLCFWMIYNVLLNVLLKVSAKSGVYGRCRLTSYSNDHIFSCLFIVFLLKDHYRWLNITFMSRANSRIQPNLPVFPIRLWCLDSSEHDTFCQIPGALTWIQFNNLFQIFFILSRVTSRARLVGCATIDIFKPFQHSWHV